jgi:hypothetical protein
MDASTGRTTSTFTLQPTPQRERLLAVTLWRCCDRPHTALAPRRTRSQQRGASVTCYQQQAASPDRKATRSEYAKVNSLVVQEVRVRLDRASHACFRRVQAGATAGSPRLQGRNRYDSFAATPFGNGARRDNGVLVLSTIGRVALRWSRPRAGLPKTVTSCLPAAG